MECRKIELFIPDGDPTSYIICDVANWNGKIFRIPKRMLRACRGQDCRELDHTGVYILIGGDEMLRVYIGEAENLYDRLIQHMHEEFWNECLAITSKDKTINKAHAKYLEHVFHQIAKDAGRCSLMNSCTPTKSSISKADEATMGDFSQIVRNVISVLGYRFLTPIRNQAEQAFEQFEILPTDKHPERFARSVFTNDGLVVLEDSTCAPEFSKSSTKTLRKKWQELHDSGTVKNNKFVKDYLASSPSSAAAMVLGRNANGLTEWKNKNGQSLKEYLEGINLNN